MFTFLTQSKLEVKKEADESPPSEAACLCSPPPAKNQCASCGMEIQDRYLLKVRNLKTSGGKYLHIHKYLPISCLVQALLQTLKSSDGFSFFCPPPVIYLIFLARSTHYSAIISPVFLRRLITWTGTWVVWNVQSAERLYANTTAATLKTKKSFANWIISGRAQVWCRRSSCKCLSGNKSDTIIILERSFSYFWNAIIEENFKKNKTLIPITFKN